MSPRRKALNSAPKLECRKTREAFVERFLATWQTNPWGGGSVEQRLETGVLKIDVMRATQEGYDSVEGMLRK